MEYYSPPPPFSCILQTIQKIKRQKAIGVLVILNWPTQPCYPLIAPLLLHPRLVCPPSKRLLYLPAAPESPFSTLLFRCRWRKIMTAKLYFCVPSPLKKLVLALQSLKMFCFYFTFCSWSYKTTNKVSGWRNFSPATAKYVSGKRTEELHPLAKNLELRICLLSGSNSTI